MMENFRQFLHNIFHKYFNSDDAVAPEIKRLNVYINGIYKILSWEDPVLSWRTLGVIHFVLWIVLQLRLRIYSVISIAVLLLFLTDVYFERSGVIPDDSSESVHLNNLLTSSKEFVTNIQYFRKTNPKKFCVTFSGFFLFLLILSTNISGFLLAYFILISVFFTPLIASKIPPEYLLPIKRTIHRLKTEEGIITEADLMPLVSEKDLDSLLTDKSQDSVSNSLLGGLVSMPSHLDIEGSLDDLEDDLEIPVKSSKGSAVSYTPGDLSTDSDSEHKGITFESSHFNGDSSSEEEEKRYTAGLKFSEESMDVPDHEGTNLEEKSTEMGLLSNLLSVGQNLFSSTAGKSESTSKRHDSDSDYEIITSEDVE